MVSQLYVVSSTELKDSNRGFSLIELMLVIVIMSVLASLAWSSYDNYRIKSNRGDVKAYMQLTAQNLVSWQTVNVGQPFSTAAYQTAGGAATFPLLSQALYNLTFTPVDNNADGVATDWTLTATPIAGTKQAGDGVVCYNSAKQKYWVKAATVCALTDSSNWE